MVEESFHDKVRRIGYGYFMFSICFAGILGNILVLVILLKQRTMGTLKTAQHYLILMTISDITVLIFAVVRYRSYAIFLSDHDLVSHALYYDPYIEVYIEPLFYIALGTSSYITVFLSLDRYIAIKYPLFCMKSSTSSIAAYFLAASSVHLMAGLTSPLWFSYTVKEYHFMNRTIVASKVTDFGKESYYECRFHQLIIPIVWYVIPWCVMAVLNTMLYFEVLKSSFLCRNVTRIGIASRRLSTIVLFVVLVHMVCSFPRCMTAIYNMVHSRDGHSDAGNTHIHCAPHDRSVIYDWVTFGANLLNVLNSCINICIYCGLGSKFRQELKHFFLCRKMRNKVAPITCVIASLESKVPASGDKAITPEST